MKKNILPIALLIFFIALFVYKAASEYSSDHAAMKDYRAEVKLHPYQKHYTPVPQNLINKYYNTTTDSLKVSK
jgi:hypothetical protein